MYETWYPTMLAHLFSVGDSRITIVGQSYVLAHGNNKAYFDIDSRLIKYDVGNKTYVWSGTTQDTTALAWVNTVFNDYRNTGATNERRGRQ